MSGDLDLTEAIDAATSGLGRQYPVADLSVIIYPDGAGPFSVEVSRVITAAVTAAAPILFRQVAEKTAERIEDSAGALLPTNAYWKGHIEGMCLAAQVAREVAR